MRFASWSPGPLSESQTRPSAVPATELTSEISDLHYSLKGKRRWSFCFASSVACTSVEFTLCRPRGYLLALVSLCGPRFLS